MKNITLLFILLSIGFLNSLQAQATQTFTSAGTQDQYVPVVFGFTNKPFSISRANIHEDRTWLAYGIATINGIGYGWGSGNTMIKLENFTNGIKNADSTGEWYSYIGKVLCEWIKSGIIVYVRGGTTYYTDGIVQRNDGVYTAQEGTQKNLTAVPLTEPGFNIPRGVYVADWEINANTRSLNNTSTNTQNIYSSNGNIGIGTTTPESSLDIRANGSSPIIRGNGGYIPTGLRFIDDSYTQPGQIKEWAIWKGNTFTKGLSFMRYDAVDRCGTGICDIVLQLSDNGNIGIGIPNPQNKLDVNGTVHAKEVKVDMSGWADFVFHKDYQLPTLTEVERHIIEKGHLPNIPNTKEVTENGLSLGENQKLLLQKIEELTLYSIEQNKQLKQQTEINKKLEQRLSKLEKK